jgi:hypothetical protein
VVRSPSPWPNFEAPAWLAECGGPPQLPRPLRSLGQGPRGPDRQMPEPGPLVEHPLLVGRPGVGDVQPLEKGSLVRRHRCFETGFLAAVGEGQRVAPDHGAIEADLILPLGDNGAFAQRPAQVSERLAQSVPGVLLILLGPEQGHDGVATAAAPPGRHREIGQEGETLGLDDLRPGFLAVSDPQPDRPQGLQLEHAPHPPVTRSNLRTPRRSGHDVA